MKQDTEFSPLQFWMDPNPRNHSDFANARVYTPTPSDRERIKADKNLRDKCIDLALLLTSLLEEEGSLDPMEKKKVETHKVPFSFQSIAENALNTHGEVPMKPLQRNANIFATFGDFCKNAKKNGWTDVECEAVLKIAKNAPLNQDGYEWALKIIEQYSSY